MITALIYATVRAIVIDGLAAFGVLCAAAIILAAIWAALFRRRRENHKNTRGYE